MVPSGGCEPVSVRTVTLSLCRAETTPLSKGGGTVPLENVPAGKAAFLRNGCRDTPRHCLDI